MHYLGVLCNHGELLINIAEYTFIPSLHVEVIRILYYGGAFVSSLVFFDKDFASAATKNKIAACLLMGAMAAIFGEALVFYLDLPYGAAILSCVGLLVIYVSSLGQRKNIVGMLTGVVMILLPILPKFTEGGLDLDKMSMKREIAVRNLIKDQPK